MDTYTNSRDSQATTIFMRKSTSVTDSLYMHTSADIYAEMLP